MRKENDLVPLIPLILNKWFKNLNFGFVFAHLGSLCWKEVTDARNHSESKHNPGMLHCLVTVCQSLRESEGRGMSTKLYH